jgi:hypothetical protein
MVLLDEAELDKTCTIGIGSDSYENLLYDWPAGLLITFEIDRFAVI